jgi:hypothetical protein
MRVGETAQNSIDDEVKEEERREFKLFKEESCALRS